MDGDVGNLIFQYAGSICCNRLKLEILHAVNMRKIRQRSVGVLFYLRRDDGSFSIVKKIKISNECFYYETQVIHRNGQRNMLYLFQIRDVEQFFILD